MKILTKADRFVTVRNVKHEVMGVVTADDLEAEGYKLAARDMREHKMQTLHLRRINGHFWYHAYQSLRDGSIGQLTTIRS